MRQRLVGNKQGGENGCEKVAPQKKKIEKRKRLTLWIGLTMSSRKYWINLHRSETNRKHGPSRSSCPTCCVMRLLHFSFASSSRHWKKENPAGKNKKNVLKPRRACFVFFIVVGQGSVKTGKFNPLA